MLLLLKRWKMYWSARRLALAWRKVGGGGMRYRFHFGGGEMGFSAPECETTEQLAQVLEDAAAVLRAPKQPVLRFMDLVSPRSGPAP